MENIFKDAYFGKPYKTKDGRKAIYTIMSYNSHWLIIQDTSFTWEYNNNGELISGIDEAMNIVSEWQEPINEEELDGLATEFIGNHVKGTPPLGCEAYIEFAYICYKAGYRKAKGE